MLLGIQKFLKALDLRALAFMMHFLFLEGVMAQKAQHTAHLQVTALTLWRAGRDNE